jgi:hypothetical protein
MSSARSASRHQSKPRRNALPVGRSWGRGASTVFTCQQLLISAEPKVLRFFSFSLGRETLTVCNQTEWLYFASLLQKVYSSVTCVLEQISESDALVGCVHRSMRRPGHHLFFPLKNQSDDLT